LILFCAAEVAGQLVVLHLLHKSRFKENLGLFPEEEDDDDGGDLLPWPFSWPPAQSRFTPNSRSRLEPEDATDGGSACPGGAVGVGTGTDSSTTVAC
jgi:hypothetical protein